MELSSPPPRGEWVSCGAVRISVVGGGGVDGVLLFIVVGFAAAVWWVLGWGCVA